MGLLRGTAGSGKSGKSAAPILKTVPHSSITALYRVNKRFNMPVKSSHLSVIKWPNLETIRRRWLPGSKSSVVPNLPCFAPDILVPMPAGIGVGRDLDVIIIVKYAEASFMERGLAWDLTHLPVPVDLVIYNQEEWEEMVKRGDHFTRVVGAEAVWL